MNKLSLPFGVKPHHAATPLVAPTTQGTYKLSEQVFLSNIRVPEFVNGRHICGVSAHLFDSPTCPYDVILGQDFL